MVSIQTLQNSVSENRSDNLQDLVMRLKRRRRRRVEEKREEKEGDEEEKEEEE